MNRNKRAGELNRTIGSHVYQVRRGTAGKFLRESVIAIERVIVSIEANALVLFLQSQNKRGHAIEFVPSHLNVLGFPRCAHDVMNRFGVQEKAALFAVVCQRREIFKIFKIDCGVDLYCVVLKTSLDVVQRTEDRRQSVETTPARKLLAVECVDRYL